MTTDLDAVEAEIPARRDTEAPTRVPPAITTEFGHRITFPDVAQSMVEPAVAPTFDQFDDPAAFDTDPAPWSTDASPDAIAAVELDAGFGDLAGDA
jgi:hypothetical protein